MKKMIVAVMVLIGCLFTVNVGAQNPSKEYRDALTKFLTVSGGLSTYDAMLDMMFEAMPQITAEKKTAIREKAAARFIELIAPAYEKHIALGDLQEAVKFYESPAGKRIQAAQKPMLTESMKVGHKLGMELQQMVMSEM